MMLTRRTALHGLAGLAATGVLVSAHAGFAQRRRAPPPILPPRLREGDKVGLVCPAGFIADRFGLETVSGTVRAMGLEPVAGNHLLDRHGYLAGKDEERAADFMAMVRDPQIRGIFAVRGGWGSQRILPLLDFAAIRANPKLLIGSSDITALHLAYTQAAGLASLHSPNVAHSWPIAVWEQFRALAFDGGAPTYEVPEAPSYGLAEREPRVRSFAGGKARGRLLGGNLTVLASLVGTPWLPDFTGAILFLEDTNEAEYRIDRMMTQLAQAGLFEAAAGVVFGQCTNCSNPGTPYSNFTIYEVLDHHLGKLGKPAFQGARIGHIRDQVSMPLGIEAEIDADAGTIRLLGPVVR